jgi:putative membrane protein
MSSEISAKPLDGTALAKERTDFAAERTGFAVSRTRLASERTLMAALRTSLSLISFGFTIYKFFDALRKSMGEEGPIRPQGPRRLGLTLVSLGVFVLIAFASQHWLFLRRLQRETRTKFPVSVSLIASGLLALTGIVVFVVILIRL